MTITELTTGGALLRALRRVRAAEPARTGVHLSSILEDIAVRAGWHRRYDSGPVSDQGLVLQEIGNALEEIIAAELRRKAGWVKPEPRCHDGIICSPDGVNPDLERLDEMKACWAQWTDRDTFFASGKGLKYLWQVQGYGHVWKYQKAHLHVLFVRGAKGGAPLPLPKTFVLQWTASEAALKWHTIRQHGKDLGWLSPADIRHSS